MFSELEIGHPEKCEANDIFLAIVNTDPEHLGEDLGVQVYRNGKATNRWEDGTIGVPQDIRDLAEKNESLCSLKSYPIVTADIWRNVTCDEEGRFIWFGKEKQQIEKETNGKV